MQHKLKFASFVFVLFLAISTFAFAMGNPKQAGSYKFITQDFLDTLKTINAEHFYSQPLPTITELKEGLGPNYVFPEGYLEHQALALPNGELMRRGEVLCNRIQQSYESLFEKKEVGLHAFMFDEELRQSMREAGAYALPLRVLDGKIFASYINPNWERDDPKQGGHAKFFENYHKTVSNNRVANLNPGGQEIAINVWPHHGARAAAAGIFHSFAVGVEDLRLEKFDLSITIKQDYLFVFRSDPESLNEESAYFFISFPFEAASESFGIVEKVQLASEWNVDCSVVTKSGMKIRANDTGIMGSKPKDSRNLKNVYHAIPPIEPLTFPLHAEYGSKEVLSENGKFIPNKDGYLVDANSLAEPSLVCWMQSMSLLKGNHPVCAKTNYGEEYIAILNSDICVSAEGVKSVVPRSYPVQVKKPGHFLGAYSSYKVDEADFCN
ncbi:MAG: hypothetical protein KKA05_11020 [Alphaproteobacteria bacterium]|nr:hypothetical protein [Alphaproteobacteria bacterium]